VARDRGSMSGRLRSWPSAVRQMSPLRGLAHVRLPRRLPPAPTPPPPPPPPPRHRRPARLQLGVLAPSGRMWVSSLTHASGSLRNRCMRAESTPAERLPRLAPSSPPAKGGRATGRGVGEAFSPGLPLGAWDSPRRRSGRLCHSRADPFAAACRATRRDPSKGLYASYITRSPQRSRDAIRKRKSRREFASS
jgi:hypothetical protein